MNKKSYQLRFLPIFYDDLEEKVTYIKDALKNQDAANGLLDKVENAILERLPFAESFEPYHSMKKRKDTYYRIYVDNYIIYYVVIAENGEAIMEVRRFMFKGQDRNRIIK